jgi:signal transduction histidine kinase
MNQVIRNLISNALKFTPIGGNVKMQAVFTHNSISDIDEEPRNRQVSREKGIAPHRKSLVRYIQRFNIISWIPFVPL